MNPKILEIDGWMHPTELEWLYNTAQRIPEGGLIIEIGAWKGRSSAAIYEGTGNGKVIVSVDTWKGQDDLPDHQIAKEIDLFRVYLTNMESLGFFPKRFPVVKINNVICLVDKYITCKAVRNGIYYIIGDSVDSATLFKDKSIDWLFIDGDHRLCGEDIDAYLPKMKDAGIITGHDYFCFYETIQQEIHKRFYIHELHDSIWVRYVGLSKPWWY